MARSITIRDTQRNQQSGEVTLCVGKSREISFADLKAMNDSFDETSERDELLIGLLVAWCRKQPNGKWSDCKGKTITLDLDASDGVIVKVANG